MTAETQTQLDRIEQMLTTLVGVKQASPVPLPPDDTLTVEQAMAELHYTNRAAFWRAVHASRIPFIRVNPRRCLFSRRALDAWRERKSLHRAVTTVFSR